MSDPFPTTREATILAILASGELYGREIRNQYRKLGGGVMPLGSLYTTLARMEHKGYVSSRMGDSLHERGGNRRKYFRIRAAGAAALDAYQARASGLLRLELDRA